MSEFTLEPVLLSSPFNFEHFELRDSLLVVDGDDFVRYCSGLVARKQSNDEWLELSLEAFSLLSHFKEFDVEPIFLFEGLASENVPEIRSNVTEKHPSMWSPMARLTILGVLKCCSVQRMVVNEPISRAVYSLAVRLQCPVLGSKNAYYFMSSNPSSAVKFIPFSLLKSDMAPAEFLLFLGNGRSNTNAGLITYTFFPKGTSMEQMDPKCGHLLALSWDAGLTYTNGQLSISNNTAPLSDDYVRFKSLTEWIHNQNINHEDQLAGLLYDGDHDQLVEACNLYKCLPDTVGDRLLSILQSPLMTEGTHQIDPARIRERSSSSTSQMEPKSVSHESRFLSGWPPKLGVAYRRGEIPLPLAASLYLPKDSHQRNRVELTDAIEMHFSQPFTLLSARILVGMEQRIRNQDKLQGLDDNQSVLVIGSPQSPRSCSVSIEPFSLNFRLDRTDSVLRQLFGLPNDIDTVKPDWLLSLGFAIGLWYHQMRSLSSVAADSPVEPLSQCSFVLSVVSVAVATVFNIDGFDSELRSHFDRVERFVQSELDAALARGSKSSEVATEPTGGYHSLQLVYQSLRSLVVLLDSVLHPDAASQLFRFIPHWIAFPSGKLVQDLTTHLHLQMPAVRSDLTKHFWLPKFILSNRQEDIEQARDVFDRLLQLASVVINPDTAFLQAPTPAPSMYRRTSVSSTESDEMWPRGKKVPGRFSEAGKFKMNDHRTPLREVSNFTLPNL